MPVIYMDRASIESLTEKISVRSSMRTARM